MREPLLMVAVGQKGVGKTYTTTQMISQYVSANPNTGKSARKVLIYDVNMEYEQFARVGVDDVKRFTMQELVEVRRVVPLLPDGRKANLDQMVGIMSKILETFAGGLLILEDINKYLTATQSQVIIGTLETNRHVDLDIIIHLQSLAAVTPRMFQNCSVIRFHKQQDEIDRYKNRIPYLELIRLAELLVDYQYYNIDKRFYCYVSGEENYIKGKFSDVAFRKACEEYAQQYSPKLQRWIKSFKGEKNAREKAIKKIADELDHKYNGNKR